MNKSSIGPSGFIARQTFSFFGRVAENSFETCLFLMRSISNERKIHELFALYEDEAMWSILFHFFTAEAQRNKLKTSSFIVS